MPEIDFLSGVLYTCVALAAAIAVYICKKPARGWNLFVSLGVIAVLMCGVVNSCEYKARFEPVANKEVK